MRDSFVFYRSFFEAICELPKKDRLPLFNSICDYALNGVEPELSGTSSAVFKLLKPQIDANNRKRENGLKGGRGNKANQNQNETKTKPNENQRQTKSKPNVNVNVNVNENGDSEPNGNQKGVPISPEQKANRDRIMRGLEKALQ